MLIEIVPSNASYNKELKSKTRGVSHQFSCMVIPKDMVNPYSFYKDFVKTGYGVWCDYMYDKSLPCPYDILLRVEFSEASKEETYVDVEYNTLDPIGGQMSSIYHKDMTFHYVSDDFKITDVIDRINKLNDDLHFFKENIEINLSEKKEDLCLTK